MNSDQQPSLAEEIAQLEALVEEQRELAEQNPDNIYPLYADALVGLSGKKAQFGLKDQALTAALEAARQYRLLAEIEPEGFTVHLASALNNLSNRLTESGRDADARKAGEEAIRLAGENLAQAPEQARFVLVSGLLNQAARSWRANDPTNALAEVQQAAQAFREGGEAMMPFLGIMVEALHRNALALAEGGNWGDALVVRRLTVEVFPQPAPAPVRQLMALTQQQAAFALSRGGKPGDALPLVEEAAQTARELAEADADGFTLFLAQSLGNLASRQHEAGASAEALDAVVEAVNLFQKVATTDAASAIAPLTVTLETFASILMALGHEEQARAVLAQRDELVQIAQEQ